MGQPNYANKQFFGKSDNLDFSSPKWRTKTSSIMENFVFDWSKLKVENIEIYNDGRKQVGTYSNEVLMKYLSLKSSETMWLNWSKNIHENN